MNDNAFTGLFENASFAVKLGLLYDGNLIKFRQCIEAEDPDQFFERLHAFSTSLGSSALRLTLGGDRNIEAIAADVKAISDGIGYLWHAAHFAPIGRA
ncbi:MAG: hypothetical protein AAAC47_13915 [Pararhizobium sp.]